MHGIVIRDGTEKPGGGLEFGLAEVLKSLGHRVASSRWECQNLHYLSRDEKDIPALQTVSRGGSVTGSDLLAALPSLLQVIDGEFRASEMGRKEWVVVKAVDSSWWEVLSDEPAVLTGVRSRFRVVNDLPT